MKKVAILFLFISVFSVSQENLFWGLKAGANYTTLVGKDVNKYGSVDPFTSVHAGAFVNYSLTDIISVQAEILGTIHGAKLNYNINIINQDVDISAKSYLPYIALPVMAKFMTFENFYFEIGPQVGILFQEDFIVKVAGEEITEGLIPNIVRERLKHLRKVDFGANAGISYRFYDKLSIYTRFYKGFLSMDSRGDNQRDLKNQVFMLGLEYGF